MRETRSPMLWLRNTSRYPNEEVWPLFQEAYDSAVRNMRPEDRAKFIPRIMLTLTNASCRRRGRYLGTIHVPHGLQPGQGRTWNSTKGGYEQELIQWKHILCRIGAPSHWPVANETYYRYKDMAEYPINDHREGLVHIIAHEMEHAFGAGGRKKGEERCEAAAQDAVDLYRKNRDRVDMDIKARLALEASRTEARQRREEQKHRGPSVEVRAERAMAQIAAWKRRHKLAETKIRKYERDLRRLSKQMEKELAAMNL
jgi:hypothetical protein